MWGRDGYDIPSGFGGAICIVHGKGETPSASARVSVSTYYQGLPDVNVSEYICIAVSTTISANKQLSDQDRMMM